MDHTRPLCAEYTLGFELRDGFQVRLVEPWDQTSIGSVKASILPPIVSLVPPKIFNLGSVQWR